LPIVLISGSLNLPGPSGPVQDYSGIALPFSAFHPGLTRERVKRRFLISNDPLATCCPRPTGWSGFL